MERLYGQDHGNSGPYIQKRIFPGVSMILYFNNVQFQKASFIY